LFFTWTPEPGPGSVVFVPEKPEKQPFNPALFAALAQVMAAAATIVVVRRRGRGYHHPNMPTHLADALAADSLRTFGSAKQCTTTSAQGTSMKGLVLSGGRGTRCACSLPGRSYSSWRLSVTAWLAKSVGFPAKPAAFAPYHRTRNALSS
jgi:hypothetical protein